MLYRIRSSYRQLRKFISISRQKGNGIFASILLLLPVAVISKGYARIARGINNSRHVFSVNYLRIRNCHSGHQHKLGGHFYMIVMPGMLHFLIPALRLIPPDINVFLVFNGARNWEKNYLESEFPQLARVNLLTLPGSSISHGIAISLFLKSNSESFGILDHDLYIFDREIFHKLHCQENQCMLAFFQSQSLSTGFVYPHTCFLYFNTRLLRKIMNRYGVDARIYRKIPETAAETLSNIGIRQGVFLKEYHNYFDTLHLMLALCFAEGLEIGYVETDEQSGIYHIGGTSIGSHITKDLSHSYIALRFLEHANNPLLNSKYAHLFTKWGNAHQIRGLIPASEENTHMLFVLDQIMEKLEAYIT